MIFPFLKVTITISQSSEVFNDASACSPHFHISFELEVTINHVYKIHPAKDTIILMLLIEITIYIAAL